MKISTELIEELKNKKEAIVEEVMPLLQAKDYLQELMDPTMLPLIAASFIQSLNGALETGSLDSFKNTVAWLFQMAEAKQLTEPLVKFLDFLGTIEQVVKKNVTAAYQAELDSFSTEVKAIFQEAALSKNA